MVLLGVFAKLRKATVNFLMSVCLSAWNNSAVTGQILMTFDICVCMYVPIAALILSLSTRQRRAVSITPRPLYPRKTTLCSAQNGFPSRKYRHSENQASQSTSDVNSSAWSVACSSTQSRRRSCLTSRRHVAAAQEELQLTLRFLWGAEILREAKGGFCFVNWKRSKRKSSAKWAVVRSC